MAPTDIFHARVTPMGRHPCGDADRDPIQYIAASSKDAAGNLAHRLQQAGFLVNRVSYPAAPRQGSGIRVALTLHQTSEDISSLVEAIAEHLPLAPADEQTSTADLVRAFHRSSLGENSLCENGGLLSRSPGSTLPCRIWRHSHDRPAERAARRPT